MVDSEEVRHRLKEKIKEKYPKAKFSQRGEDLIVDFGNDRKSTFYPNKLRDEMNWVHPTEWDEMINKRIRSIPIGNEPKILRLVPRIYSKAGLRKTTGVAMTRAELEKAGITILKEVGEDWIVLAAETEDAYITLPEKEILKQMSKREYKAQKERAKKLLDYML